MTLRTLLLGSAAALLTVGGAQAADLGAEPVNYVKVCDAFGAGYYYAPGTDTCIKVYGYVRLDTNFLDITVAGYPDATHAFSMYNTLGVVAATMTEYGPLIGDIDLAITVGAPSGAGVFPSSITTAVGIDHATLQLGPLSAGYNWSSYSPFTEWAHLFNIGTVGYTGAAKTQFIQLSTAVGGAGVWIAAEDYRTRDLGTTATGVIPDITAGINFGASPFNIAAAFGYGDRNVTDTWGAKARVTVGLGGLGNLLLVGAYSKNTSEWINGIAGAPVTVVGDWASISGALTTNLSPQVALTLAGAWMDRVDAAGAGMADVWANISFFPVRNMQIGAEVQHTMPEGGVSSTKGVFRLQRAFP